MWAPWAQSLLGNNFPECEGGAGGSAAGMEDWPKGRERVFQQKLTSSGQASSEEALALSQAGSEVLMSLEDRSWSGKPNSQEKGGVPVYDCSLHFRAGAPGARPVARRALESTASEYEEVGGC